MVQMSCTSSMGDGPLQGKGGRLGLLNRLSAEGGHISRTGVVAGELVDPLLCRQGGRRARRAVAMPMQRRCIRRAALDAPARGGSLAGGALHL
jgi:hypothetical protein